MIDEISMTGTATSLPWQDIHTAPSTWHVIYHTYIVRTSCFHETESTTFARQDILVQIEERCGSSSRDAVEQAVVTQCGTMRGLR
ncbi:hypothetical protein M378DRAFT_381449 [Amanita muscaria Koide BX008]|uniref:Uncharacterized protein n=1 Tax=Amanita muscaria (strain Koide BX008) TaxID=946122 RepID=A0A0C2S4D7_AMAMK|nr:hypothetical protein M378DRAFT_381449 [Amanita muscaria Koide BX008]